MAATKTPRAPSKKSVAKKVGKKKRPTKPQSKKAAVKNVPAKKSAGKKASTKKPSAKKAPIKKPAKKSVLKKSASKNAAAETSATLTSAKKKPTAKAAKKASAKQAGSKRTENASKRSHAVDAMSELVQKRSIKRALTAVEDGKTVVDAYMRDVDHPFKAELVAVRQIILGASSKIAERIKWNAPSFYYKEDLGAFNPRATQYAHLILLFPGGVGMDDDTGLLEGNHKDRREAKFHNMADVNAKKPALEALVQRWVELRDD